MISSRYPRPQALTDLWEQQWPECPPMAYLLRSRYPDRWVRFHSLPGSKRYPDNEDEYGTVLDRHYTVLDQLGAGPLVLVITTEWTDTEELTPQRWPRRAEVAPRAHHWRTFVEDPEDPEYRTFHQLYVEALQWTPQCIDGLLRAVADDELANVMVAPLDLHWLYHPYDGGADVVLPAREQRDELKHRYRDWLSDHPSGL
ncbi:hypothetical protein CS0771_60050 [Catellatospora sp. IY07-71]|nr:hypothetical protein CS0771_60050 [Catellatospora sp. IY07-71]